eukprot:1145029-Pelagomonas_calceolata.AAC.8
MEEILFSGYKKKEGQGVSQLVQAQNGIQEQSSTKARGRWRKTSVTEIHRGKRKVAKSISARLTRKIESKNEQEEGGTKYQCNTQKH